MRNLLFTISALVFYLLIPATARAAPAVLDSVAAASSIHLIDGLFGPAGDGLLVSDEQAGKLTLYALEGGKLVAKASAAAADTVHAAAVFEDRGAKRIAVAFGYGRKNPKAPIEVYLYDAGLDKREKIFERATERSETTYLGQRGAGLEINFFESKYFTVFGDLQPASGSAWTLEERIKARLGMQVDRAEDAIAIGRPYGDVAGQDGDVRIYLSGSPTLLPSYRGVSALRFVQLDEDPESEIMIGDGWHQDYGQLAQGRLSMLDRDGVSGRYRLELVELDPAQYAFTRIAGIEAGGKRLVLAMGNKQLKLYDPASAWKSSVIYEHTGPEAVLDFVPLGSSAGKLYIAILDTKLILASAEL